MGFGDFGSNRSVHWRVSEGEGANAKEIVADHPDSTKRHPEDTTKDPGLPVIGAGKASPQQNHPGTIRVTARFIDAGAARVALNAALNAIDTNGVVKLDVPIREVRSNPWDPAEVSVDW